MNITNNDDPRKLSAETNNDPGQPRYLACAVCNQWFPIEAACEHIRAALATPLTTTPEFIQVGR